jgi:helix-turn-helix protein
MTDKEQLMTLTLSASPLKVKTAIDVLEGQESCENPHKWLSEKEAMKYASIGRSCLWFWRTKQNLKSFKVNGRRLFRAVDIDEFIIDQSQGVE